MSATECFLAADGTCRCPKPPPTPLWENIVGGVCFGLLMLILVAVLLACVAAGRYRR
jgi:hypothetical protein